MRADTRSAPSSCPILCTSFPEGRGVCTVDFETRSYQTTSAHSASVLGFLPICRRAPTITTSRAVKRLTAQRALSAGSPSTLSLRSGNTPRIPPSVARSLRTPALRMGDDRAGRERRLETCRRDSIAGRDGHAGGYSRCGHHRADRGGRDQGDGTSGNGQAVRRGLCVLTGLHRTRGGRSDVPGSRSRPCWSCPPRSAWKRSALATTGRLRGTTTSW